MTTAVAALCLALAATGCHNGSSAPAPQHTTTPAAPQTSTTASPRPTASPALGKQAALDLIRRYSQVNNLANKSDNAKLLDTVEDGPLYAMSLGGYKQDSGLKGKDKDRSRFAPFSYDTTTAHLYIPRFLPGQQRWFAAGVTITGSKNQRILVFAQQPQRWELVYVADLDGMPLPDVALDAGGYATAVPADGSGVPRFDAGQLRIGVMDNFATGGTNSGQQFFTPTPASRRQVGVHADAAKRFGNKGSSTFAPANNIWTDAYGLQVAGGGALILFSHTHTQTDRANPGFQVTPDPDTRAWLDMSPRQFITDTFICNDAAVKPATGKAKLLGYTCELTDVEGPAVGLPVRL